MSQTTNQILSIMPMIFPLFSHSPLLLSMLLVICLAKATTVRDDHSKGLIFS